MSEFAVGTYVRKKSGAFWEGSVVGHYSTQQTPDGVAVQLFGWEDGPVQIYPAAALELCDYAESRLPPKPATRLIALDEVYAERNKVVAALSKLFPSGVKTRKSTELDSAYDNCVYIDLPTGQVSWHFYDRDAEMFAHLPQYNGDWDGHDTPEKYRRLAALTAPPPSTHVGGLELTEWERSRLAQYVAGNALTYMGHFDRGGLKPHEIEEMERWKALSDKLKTPAPQPREVGAERPDNPACGNNVDKPR